MTDRNVFLDHIPTDYEVQEASQNLKHEFYNQKQRDLFGNYSSKAMIKITDNVNNIEIGCFYTDDAKDIMNNVFDVDPTKYMLQKLRPNLNAAVNYGEYISDCIDVSQRSGKSVYELYDSEMNYYACKMARAIKACEMIVGEGYPFMEGADKSAISDDCRQMLVEQKAILDNYVERCPEVKAEYPDLFGEVNESEKAQILIDCANKDIDDLVISSVKYAKDDGRDTDQFEKFVQNYNMADKIIESLSAIHPVNERQEIAVSDEKDRLDSIKGYLTEQASARQQERFSELGYENFAKEPVYENRETVETDYRYIMDSKLIREHLDEYEFTGMLEKKTEAVREMAAVAQKGRSLMENAEDKKDYIIGAFLSWNGKNLWDGEVGREFTIPKEIERTEGDWDLFTYCLDSNANIKELYELNKDITSYSEYPFTHNFTQIGESMSEELSDILNTTPYASDITKEFERLAEENSFSLSEDRDLMSSLRNMEDKAEKAGIRTDSVYCHDRNISIGTDQTDSEAEAGEER